MSKRVLIITYYWPPSAGSGVQRWLKFAKYLPEFGWTPVIYTPENPDFPFQDESLFKDIPASCEVIKTKIWEPYKYYRMLTGGNKEANFGLIREEGKKESLLKRLAIWVRSNLFIPDPRRFWVGPSVRFLKKYLKENQIDAIVTTGPPHSMHLIGLGLKKALPDLYWIADMRDPWSKLDFLISFNMDESTMQKYERLEKEVLDNADDVVMISPSLHGEFVDFDHSKLQIIHNGYDEDDFTSFAEPTPKPEAFTIYHTGLLNPVRNPEQLWVAIKELCEENAEFKRLLRIHLIGNVDAGVKAMLQNDPILSERVIIEGWMAHAGILEAYKKAEVLLLLFNKSRIAYAQTTGKIFEYLATGKSILGIGLSTSDGARILEETGQGVMIDDDRKDAMKAELLRLFNRYQQGGATTNVDKPEVQQFSRRALTKKLVGLLEANTSS